MATTQEPPERAPGDQQSDDANLAVPPDLPLQTQRPWYRRRTVIAAGAVALVVAVAYGIGAWAHARAHESTDDAFVDGQVIQITPQVAANVLAVHVADNQVVKKGDLLVELDPRDVQAKLEQARAALAEAQTRHSAARSNVELTRASTRAGVRQATSGMEAARASVGGARGAVSTAAGRARQARAAVATAEANVERARAEVEAAQAEATRAAADVERYRQLLELDEVSRQQFDAAQAAARSSEAQLVAARARVAAAETAVAEARAGAAAAEGAVAEAQSGVATAQAHVGEASGRLEQANTGPQQIAVSESEAATAGATIENARAAVAEAELQLSYTKIVAPEDGRVTMKSIEIGQLAQVGQPMMALVTSDLWVTANFKETQLDQIRPGQPAEITIDAYPGRTFRGHVDSIQSGSGAAFSLLPPENATGNYVKVVQRVPVKIVFDEQPEPALALGPGMSAEPEVRVR
jgi:membrane fusion protein (multidrug efflux system)